MNSEIKISGARENNLKNIDVSIPLRSYTVVTGLSGSGKTSLALDTLYAEGLRRYIESLSTYARQFLERVDRPDVDNVSGLPPAVAIESRNTVRNSRSTVGTTTEIYDYLRLLYAKIGRTFCPKCKAEVKRSSPEDIARDLLKNHEGKGALITFPLRNIATSAEELLSKGFVRILKGEGLIEVEGIDELPKGSEVLVDRIALEKKSFARLVDSLESAFRECSYAKVHIMKGVAFYYSKELECPTCQTRFDESDPLFFSFNSPQGACYECRGFGNVLRLDPDLVVPDPEKSLAEGAIEPFTKPSYMSWIKRLINFSEGKGIDINKPYKKLSKRDKRALFEGDDGFKGIDGFFGYLERKSYKMHVRAFLSKYRSAVDCELCGGSRLKKEALWVKVDKKDIHELSVLPITGLKIFFEEISLSDYENDIASEILKQINSRIDFLIRVGLEYLTLSRLSRSLSGGESQRVSLACQLGSTLTETLYIMDEPSIGLHPRDISRLTLLIKELRDRDNTVVVVEHDFEMIKSADYVVELGPHAGEKGGEVAYEGGIKGLLNKTPQSLTKLYLTGEKRIPVPTRRRKGSGKSLSIIGAQENNLKNLNVSFPLRTFICVTGVSGSGKSSLVGDVLYSSLARRFHGDVERVGKYKEIRGDQHVSDVIMLDQNPIGKSGRSNPVTYIKAYDKIRKTFAATWYARSRGFTPSHFSFNVVGGRCETCQGEGRQKIEMHFLADVLITCEECDGERFRKEILSVKYKDRNINEVLALTVNEAITFFSKLPSIVRKLKILQDVGLGYLRLGQPAPTLSGGEAQRIKIARELGRKGGKDILYVLDEPTVGLHAEDVKKLLEIVNKLVVAGNTVLVVEHNLDVIKSADYIIDMGLEGGEMGGNVVAEGTPEEVVRRSQQSHTARFLKEVLSRSP